MPEDARATATDFDKVETIAYRLSDDAYSKFRACSRMAAILLRGAPDLVHLQGWSPLLTPYMPLLKRISIVYSWHDPVVYAGEESLAMDVTQKSLKKASDKAVTLARRCGLLPRK